MLGGKLEGSSFIPISIAAGPPKLRDQVRRKKNACSLPNLIMTYGSGNKPR
jgi:hypothetical protein